MEVPRRQHLTPVPPPPPGSWWCSGQDAAFCEQLGPPGSWQVPAQAPEPPPCPSPTSPLQPVPMRCAVGRHVDAGCKPMCAAWRCTFSPFTPRLCTLLELRGLGLCFLPHFSVSTVDTWHHVTQFPTSIAALSLQSEASFFFGSSTSSNNIYQTYTGKKCQLHILYIYLNTCTYVIAYIHIQAHACSIHMIVHTHITRVHTCIAGTHAQHTRSSDRDGQSPSAQNPQSLLSYPHPESKNVWLLTGSRRGTRSFREG